MAIRTLCFVGAVIAWQTIGAWLGAVVLLVGALVLPYTSVILANAGVRRKAHGHTSSRPSRTARIEPGQSPVTDPAPEPSPTS